MTTISQADAVELFDLPSVVLYVCDGRRECGKPSCLDFRNRNTCHHTSDCSHALYETHFMAYFESHPAIRDGKAALIKVEPIRG